MLYCLFISLLIFCIISFVPNMRIYVYPLNFIIRLLLLIGIYIFMTIIFFLLFLTLGVMLYQLCLITTLISLLASTLFSIIYLPLTTFSFFIIISNTIPSSLFTCMMLKAFSRLILFDEVGASIDVLINNSLISLSLLNFLFVGIYFLHKSFLL